MTDHSTTRAPQLESLLDEARPGPWQPEDGLGFVWLHNAGGDSLHVDAGDVAALLNAAIEADVAALPAQEPLDAERDGGRIARHGWHYPYCWRAWVHVGMPLEGECECGR